MESSRYCLFPSTQVPLLYRRNPIENSVPQWISVKSTVWLWMTIPITVTQFAPWQPQHYIWHESFYSSNQTALRFITACRWWTNDQWKRLQSILLAELLPTKDMHRVSADFQVSCASTWSMLSELTNVLKFWTTLESQPIGLRTLPRTFG